MSAIVNGIDFSKGIKQADLIPCVFCGRGVAHSQQLLSTRVRITRLGVNIRAVQRQSGLEQMLGGCAPLALVMGTDENMLVEMEPERTVLVCDRCAMKHLVMEVGEAIEARDSEKGGEHGTVRSDGQDAGECGGVAGGGGQGRGDAGRSGDGHRERNQAAVAADSSAG